METAIQFGAGNIGRGFLAQLFCESGLHTTFVDVNNDVIDAINDNGNYLIKVVGPNAHEVIIDNISALHATNMEAVASLIASPTTVILCTAVGANVLTRLAPVIAKGLELRIAAGAPTINILLCENLHDAADVLRDAVSQHLPEISREEILSRTGFVQAVVSRMVPVQNSAGEDPGNLEVRVESYKHLPIDADAWVSGKAESQPLDEINLESHPASRFVGFEPVSPFEAYVERKLYTHNCAHAVLGYLGYAAGLEFGYEALEDSRILSLLRAVLQETGEALIRKHHFDAATHQAHVEDLLLRFNNRDLGDTCRRLARDPLRKLAPGDRITGAARCCESQGITPFALSWAIAAGLRYDDPEDPASVKIQQIRSEYGLEITLKRVCSIQPDEPLAGLVDAAMAAVADGRSYA